MVWCNIHHEHHHGLRRIGACYLKLMSRKYAKKTLKEIIELEPDHTQYVGLEVQDARFGRGKYARL